MNLILNDNLECILSINYNQMDIDGKRVPLFTDKKFKCSYTAKNAITFTNNNVETIAKGSVRINGDILKKDYDVYDGTCTIFGHKYDIVRIERCRNLLDSRIVDFTEIILEWVNM